jgi:hypothetical protein
LIEKGLNNRASVIIIHIVIGYLCTLSFFPKLYGVISLLLGILILIRSKNENEEAIILSCYFIGSEVFLRMTEGFVLYEAGKYTVMSFLFLGIILNPKKQQSSIYFVVYIFLLFIGIAFSQIPIEESLRKAILFNLSGPFVLGVSGFYFYNRKIKKRELLNALFFMLLPLISMVTFLYFRTPDLKEIVFGGSANYDTSGGFGPNQVATVIGVGIFITALFILLKERITGFIIIDVLLFFYFIYRGLLTFSRGGIVTAIIALIAFSLFFILYNKATLITIIKYVFLGAIFLTATWIYTSNITGGMLDNRYSGKNARGVQKKDISTGRVAILESQMKNFVKNPLGIGVGSGKFKRLKGDAHVTAASHNEFGRLIEEHGIIGILILIGLIILPLINLSDSNGYQRGYIISFLLLWFLTINHSAMRIAFPGFIYALSLIKIIDE